MRLVKELAYNFIHDSIDLSPGDFLFRQGDEARSAFILAKGQLMVLKEKHVNTSPNHFEAVEELRPLLLSPNKVLRLKQGTLEKGEIVGLEEFRSESIRMFSIQANSHCVVYEIAFSMIERMMFESITFEKFITGYNKIKGERCLSREQVFRQREAREDHRAEVKKNKDGIRLNLPVISAELERNALVNGQFKERKPQFYKIFKDPKRTYWTQKERDFYKALQNGAEGGFINETEKRVIDVVRYHPNHWYKKAKESYMMELIHQEKERRRIDQSQENLTLSREQLNFELMKAAGQLPSSGRNGEKTPPVSMAQRKLRNLIANPANSKKAGKAQLILGERGVFQRGSQSTELQMLDDRIFKSLDHRSKDNESSMAWMNHSYDLNNSQGITKGMRSPYNFGNEILKQIKESFAHRSPSVEGGCIKELADFDINISKITIEDASVLSPNRSQVKGKVRINLLPLERVNRSVKLPANNQGLDLIASHEEKKRYKLAVQKQRINMKRDLLAKFVNYHNLSLN